MNERPVRWSRRAISNLKAISVAIAKDNPRASVRVTERLWTATEHLSRHPFMGRIGRIKHSRELALSDLPYVIGYRVFESHIAIISILHAARDRPESP